MTGTGSPVVARRAEAGLTLIEAAIIMVVVFSIVGVLAPTVAATVRNAELAAATTKMGEIRDQMLQCLIDLNFNNFTIDGVKTGTKTRRLVTDADIPRDRAVTGSTLWQEVVDNATGLTDFLDRHMVFNQPRGDVANAYTTTAANYWKGAYFTGPVGPDPWGNRYVVNVEYLGAGAGGGNDVVVYSSGPDEQIDSAYTAASLTATDDDLMTLVEP